MLGCTTHPYVLVRTVLERAYHELADVSFEHGGGLVAAEEGVDGSRDAFGHAVAVAAELGSSRDSTLLCEAQENPRQRWQNTPKREGTACLTTT